MAKILIVEDDQALYNLYDTEFSARGHQVSWAKTGEEGLKMVKEIQPGMVVLDLMLPGINGLEVLSALKADSATKSVPVVILTNFGNEDNIAKALEGGAEDFVLKYKIVPEEVVDKVEVLLGEEDSGVPLTSEGN